MTTGSPPNGGHREALERVRLVLYLWRAISSSIAPGRSSAADIGTADLAYMMAIPMRHASQLKNRIRHRRRAARIR